MYCHYLRWAESPGQQCPEIMIHSLGQQLMREDPAFYRAYVTLRGDLEWRLLATVIPGALPTSGDDTVFTHAEVGVSGEKVVGSMQLDVTGSMVDTTAKAVPWFAGLDNNLKIKDECFSGSEEDLVRAHQRIMPPDPPLQGWPGSEVFIPNRFPAALPVTGLVFIQKLHADEKKTKCWAGSR